VTSFAGWGVSWGDSWGPVTVDPNAMSGSASFAFVAVGVLSGDVTPGEMQGSASLTITATLQVQASAAGGYDDKRKKRFVIKVGNKLVEYGSAAAAVKALDATVEAPEPIAEVPIRAIKAQARVFKAEQKIQNLFSQQDFAAMLDLYQQMQEEDDAEALLLLM